MRSRHPAGAWAHLFKRTRSGGCGLSRSFVLSPSVPPPSSGCRRLAAVWDSLKPGMATTRGGHGRCVRSVGAGVIGLDCRCGGRGAAGSRDQPEVSRASNPSARRGSVGGLDLNSTRPSAFDEQTRHAATLLAIHTAVVTGKVIAVDDLHHALQTRQLIGQARGNLM